MITCVVIEDQLPARNILQKYIGDVDALKLKKMFSNALDALDYLRDNHIDLLFLDVHLPKLSGIDFLQVLPQKPHVILTTAFSDYALQGYELDVVDYLLKPFSFERFLKAVVKVERLMDKESSASETKTKDNILIKVGYDLVKVNLNEIAFIKADGDYTFINCINKKLHAAYPLRHWCETLPMHQFIQVHRSFVVNARLIDKTSANTVVINKQEIPLGRVYKKDFHELYKKLHN